MLLRAGLIYVLAVATLLLGGLVAWQGAELSSRAQSVGALTKRVTALRAELATVSLREESAGRRALVAEDSLARHEALKAEAAKSPDGAPHAEASADFAAALREKTNLQMARSALETDLANAVRELEQLRGEREALKAEAADARLASERANAAAEAARDELSEVKRAPPVTPETPVAAADPAPEATQPAVPKKDAQPSHTPAAAAAAPVIKPTLVPSAIKIEPDPKAQKASPQKPKAADKTRPEKQPASKSSSGTSTAAKKTPKQATKSESEYYFPF